MRKVASLVVALALALAACGDDAATPSEADTSARLSQVFGQDDDGGYSTAATYGGLVWTAGHLPEDALPGDGIGLQTEEAMEGLQATLDEAGAGFDTVVMTNVYLADSTTGLSSTRHTRATSRAGCRHA